jgi:hypothetical protein
MLYSSYGVHGLYHIRPSSGNAAMSLYKQDFSHFTKNARNSGTVGKARLELTRREARKL